jgi:hypothetical protein
MTLQLKKVSLNFYVGTAVKGKVGSDVDMSSIRFKEIKSIEISNDS